MSEKESIEEDYPNFDYNFSSDILSVSYDEDDGYEFPLNDYSSEDDDEKSSSILPIPTLTNDEY